MSVHGFAVRYISLLDEDDAILDALTVEQSAAAFSEEELQSEACFLITSSVIMCKERNSKNNYRDWLKGVQILLSRTQAGPGRTVKAEQEQTSRNHVQAF